MKKNITHACLAVSALVLVGSAHAQSLYSYFDFTQYGTVTSGSTVTAQFGSTSGILNAPSTSLTSTGLAITGNSNAGTTGLRLTDGSLSAFTGDFSLQLFYSNFAIGANTGLFGGTTSASIDNNLNGDNAFFVAYNGAANRVRPIENGGQFGTEQLPAANAGDATGTLYDLVITYQSSTKTFTEYLNGVQVASGVNNAFSSLNAVTNFSIAGIANPAFGDNAARINVESFRFYEGTLSQANVTALDALGAHAGASAVQLAVPEPSTGLAIVFGGGLLFRVFRRHRLSPPA